MLLACLTWAHFTSLCFITSALVGPPCAALSVSQIKDPFYKFSRDPDMSLDTAPYPAGVPKPGLLAVREDAHFRLPALSQ